MSVRQIEQQAVLRRVARGLKFKLINTEIVAEVACSTLDGLMPFPEVARRLLATGVAYYTVNYVALQKCFHSAPRDVAR